MRMHGITWLTAVSVFIGNLAYGAEPAETDSPAKESTSEALMRSLLGDDLLESSQPKEPDSASPDVQSQEPTTSNNQAETSARDGELLTEYARTAEQLQMELKTANNRLLAGQTDEQTQAAQAAAIAATERLIELAKNAANSPSNSESDATGSNSGGTDGGGTAGQSQDSQGSESRGMAGTGAEKMAGSRNRQGKSEESSQRPVENVTPGQTLSTFRTTVIERSWGHLPERMRTRLLNGGGDKSLPRYETLVNRYFESLVRPDAADSSEPGR